MNLILNAGLTQFHILNDTNWLLYVLELTCLRSSTNYVFGTCFKLLSKLMLYNYFSRNALDTQLIDVEIWQSEIFYDKTNTTLIRFKALIVMMMAFCWESLIVWTCFWHTNTIKSNPNTKKRWKTTRYDRFEWYSFGFWSLIS